MILHYADEQDQPQSRKDSITPGALLEHAVLDFLAGDDPDTSKQREPSPPPPYQPLSISYPDQYSPLPSPSFSLLSPLPTPAFPSGPGMLAQQSRPVPQSLLHDPAFSPDPRTNPHFVANPGGPPRSHLQVPTPDAGQVPRSLQSGPFPPRSRSLHPDRSPDVIPPAIRHAPISASSAFPMHNIWYPPLQSSSSSASSSASSISSVLPEMTPESSTRTTPSPPSSSPPRLAVTLERQPQPPTAIPQASTSTTRPTVPVHSSSAPDLHTRPPPPHNMLSRSTTAPLASSAPAQPQTSSKPLSKHSRRPSVTALPDLDRIDELDESDPRGLAWHHGGPYEAARRAQQQAATRSKSRTKQSSRHKPVDPSTSSFSIEPGQIFPTQRFYQPPQPQVPPRHAYFPQPSPPPPPQNLPPRLVNQQLLRDDPYRREHIPAHPLIPPPPPHEQAPRFETPESLLPDPHDAAGAQHAAGPLWTVQTSAYDLHNGAPSPQAYDPSIGREPPRQNVPPRHANPPGTPSRDPYSVGPSAQPQRDPYYSAPSAQPQRDPFDGVPLAQNVRDPRNGPPPAPHRRESYMNGAPSQNAHARSVQDLQRALPPNSVVPHPEISFPPRGPAAPGLDLPPRHRPKQLVMPLPLQPMEALRHQQLQMQQQQQAAMHVSSASPDMGLARSQTYDSTAANARAQQQRQTPARSQSQNLPQGRAKDIPMAPAPNVLRKRGTLTSAAPTEVLASNASAAMFASARAAVPAPNYAPASAESAKPAQKGPYAHHHAKEAELEREREREREHRAGRKLSKRR